MLLDEPEFILSSDGLDASVFGYRDNWGPLAFSRWVSGILDVSHFTGQFLIITNVTQNTVVSEKLIYNFLLIT